MTWWHVFGGEFMGGYGLITAGESSVPPGEIAQDLAPQAPQMKWLASFDHEPADEELEPYRIEQGDEQ